MNRLLVIGNGFDLFHGLPSSYNDFKDFLYWVRNPVAFSPLYPKYIRSDSMTEEEITRRRFADQLTKYIDSNELWSNFEFALGNLNYDDLMEDSSEHLVSYFSESFKSRDNHGYQVVIEDKLKFYKQIDFHLAEWISFNNSIAIERKLNITKKNTLFLTFNYSNTLQRIYDIPQSHILHIHGSVGGSKLICGHGAKSVYRAQESDDIRESEGSRLIEEYFVGTQKYTSKIINANYGFFNMLNNIKEIYILGHSLADVDLPYFHEIYNKTQLNNPTWYYSYYSDSAYYEYRDILESIGININQIKGSKMDSIL